MWTEPKINTDFVFQVIVYEVFSILYMESQSRNLKTETGYCFNAEQNL